jgi:replication factor C small subunit
MEKNASDERGIKIIKEDVKGFARTKGLSGNFKICFLDESEKLTPDAEDALRKIVERYSANCRFIMATNYVSNIEKSLKSKFHEIKFRRLMPEEIMKRLNDIINAESLRSVITDEQIYAIAENAGGDMRNAIKTLQGLCEGRRIPLGDEELAEMMPHPDIHKVGEMVRLALRGEFTESVKLLEDLSYVYSQDEIYKVIEGAFVESDFSDEDKIKIGLALGQITKYALDDKKQLYGFVAFLARR